MGKRKNPFPGVSRAESRHGKGQWRLRRTIKGRKIDCYLPGPYGSAEFRAAYEAEIEGVRILKPVSKVGTVDWLIEHYLASVRYKNLSDIRKKTLRGQLDWLRKQAGDLPFEQLETAHIEALASRKEGATAANQIVKIMSLLFNYAIKYRLRGVTFNPAKYAERRKTSGTGYHTWTEAEIGKFLAVHSAGSKARLAMLLFLCTGAARQDAAKMGWQNVKAGRIEYSRGKTGQGADLPILPELAEELAQVPQDRLLFLCHGDRDRPYKPETLGNWFKDQCKAAGLDHCSAHGLRKAGATRLAEHGATEYEVMSFLAHTTPKQAATYVKAAGRGRLADSGMGKLSRLKTGTNVSNLSARLGK